MCYLNDDNGATSAVGAAALAAPHDAPFAACA